ncbi:MAG: FRG domain-containing protein [Moraxella sp.]|nr:FRG domain-containing protein [Moraxella sp.]
MSNQNIPEIRIDTWEKLQDFIGKIYPVNAGVQELRLIVTKDKEMSENGYIFRGQKDPEWKLSSTLERHFADNGVGVALDTYANRCEDLLNRYKPLFRGRIFEQFLLMDKQFDDELWAFGQHYDLKTPLLDWSYSFFVALYFAFIDRAEHPYRAVFILNRSILPFAKNTIKCFEPKLDIGGRLNAQKGLFTKNLSSDFEGLNAAYVEVLSSIDTGVTFSEQFNFPNQDCSSMTEVPIYKVLIASTLREKILTYLNILNVNGFTLFPDTKGLVTQCHLELENMITHLKSA